ncbi:MAG: hypothetical protein ABSF77_07835 [Spirochaetia bacterium]|jgi:hypothetical protein
MDSLDEILSDIGISLGSVEVEAFMRDELFHRRADFDGVMSRIFAGRQAVFFYDDDQASAFRLFMEKLWGRGWL